MNLLITGAWQQAKDYLPLLSQKHDVRFLQFEKDPLPCEPDWAEGIIGNGIFLSHPLKDFTRLRLIQLTSAGFDRVPMDEVNARGIKIYNARGVYSAPMAETAVSGVLQLYKGTRAFLSSQASHRWEKQRGLRELTDRRVLIAGCGSVGTECAKRFLAFDTVVTGVDLFTREDPHYRRILPLDQLDQALPETDILVLTLPLTDETRGLIGKERLRLLPDGATVVNIARGPVVDEEALIRELQSSRLSAVLDVFTQEPLPEDSPLWALPNAVITPHNSFVGDKNGKRLSETILRNLDEFLRHS